MTDLSREDRALLELARDGHEPSEMDRRRVRTALTARLGVAAGVAVSTMAVGSATSAGAGGAGMAAVAAGGASAWLGVAKVVAVIGLLGAAGGGGILVYRAGNPRPVARDARPQVASVSVQPPGRKLARSMSLDRAPEIKLSPLAVTPPVLRGGSGERGASRATPRAGANPSASPVPRTPNILESEIRLVQGGVAALHAGDARGALTLFDEYSDVYPHGLLAEECTVERVMALCALRRDRDARAAAAVFLRGHPGSPLVGRILESCGGPSNP